MRRFFLSLAAFVAVGVAAQDIITKRDGDEVQAKVTTSNTPTSIGIGLMPASFLPCLEFPTQDWKNWKFPTEMSVFCCKNRRFVKKSLKCLYMCG